jgi:hypothetical protein
VRLDEPRPARIHEDCVDQNSFEAERADAILVGALQSLETLIEQIAFTPPTLLGSASRVAGAPHICRHGLFRVHGQHANDTRRAPPATEREARVRGSLCRNITLHVRKFKSPIDGQSATWSCPTFLRSPRSRSTGNRERSTLICWPPSAGRAKSKLVRLRRSDRSDFNSNAGH